MSNCVKPAKVVLLAVGSFNPPTNMHLRMFELARDYLSNNGQAVIGGIMSPVHDQYGKKGLLPATHRCEMVRLATQSSNWIHLSSWETQQEGWTRTANSLKFHKEVLNSNCSEHDWAVRIKSSQSASCDNQQEVVKVKLLCGADLLESFAVPGLWKDEDIEDIVGNYGLVIITRSGSNPQQFIYESDLLTRLQKNISIVPEWIYNEISSTKIRRALGRGESVRYLIQDAVLDYIEKNQLYS